jgi:hypothetical protein
MNAEMQSEELMKKNQIMTKAMKKIVCKVNLALQYSMLRLLQLQSLIKTRKERNSLIYFPIRDEVFPDLSRLLVPIPIPLPVYPQAIHGQPRVERIDKLWIIY